MRSQKLFIADGHHRFETSVNFMNECEQNVEAAGVESFDKRMVTCFNSADGVTILPTHRLIRDLPMFDAQAFLQSIEKNFAVERCVFGIGSVGENEEGRKDNVFGFYPEKLRRVLSAPAEADRQAGFSPAETRAKPAAHWTSAFFTH